MDMSHDLACTQVVVEEIWMVWMFRSKINGNLSWIGLGEGREEAVWDF